MSAAAGPNAFISAPRRSPIWLRLGIWVSERISGKVMLPARLLAWYPKAALGSGVLEALVAHKEAEVGERLLKIVRIQTSFAVNCPFCIDMNTFEHETLIGAEELAALQGRMAPEAVGSFTKRELLAIQYCKLISAARLSFPWEFMQELTQEFSERELVILASTAAQVNYWARLIQALGIPPAGYSDQCLAPALTPKDGE
jgi:alkylhydroperoxidase family enzyme